MKRIFLSALIGVGMVALIFPLFSGSSAAWKPQSYPLVCRGGGSLARDGGGLVTGTPPGERNIGFVFTRGTKPAAGEWPSSLDPGECSWVNRGMHADEPDRVSQHVEAGSESLKEGGKLAPENRWYEGLQSEARYWTFMVYNNRRGELIATSARPNVPPDEGIHVYPTARLPSDLQVIERPRSYPLLCRGSESLEIAFTPSIRTIGFKFTRGTKPAGEGLDPGECSWVDRGMYADEPNKLSQDVEEGWEESLKAGKTLAPENRWYEELRSSRKSWRFMVYRQRSVLHVTSARSQG